MHSLWIGCSSNKPPLITTLTIPVSAAVDPHTEKLYAYGHDSLAQSFERLVISDR